MDLTGPVEWLVGTDTRTAKAPVEEDELEARKAEYRPSLTGLGDIYRRPTAEPLATLAATLILAGFAYQAYAAFSTHGPLAGMLVVVAAALAYRVATLAWHAQNEVVATELALRDAEMDENGPRVE